MDLRPVPQDTYSCFQGTARSRIDTAACHSEAQFTIALYHYWASTLLSDHHVPLLLTIAFPVNRLDKPSPHTVSRTPEYHLGPVALSPADTTDFHHSILRRRALDPQLAPIRWLKGLQRAIYDWAHATGRVRALRFRQYRLKTRPAERAPPLRAPLAQLALHNPHIWANSLKPVCFLCFLLFWCPLLPFIETGTLKIYTKMVLYMKNEIFDLNTPSMGFERTLYQP